MKSYNIAIIPGDGVGGEIAKEAVKIMDAVADKVRFFSRERALRLGMRLLSQTRHDDAR